MQKPVRVVLPSPYANSPAPRLSISRDFVSISPMPIAVRAKRDTQPLLTDAVEVKQNLRWYKAPFSRRVWMSNIFYLSGLDLIWTATAFLIVSFTMPFVKSHPGLHTMHRHLGALELHRLYLLSNRRIPHQLNFIPLVPSPTPFSTYFLVRKPIISALSTAVTALLIFPGIFLMINWVLLLACPSSSLPAQDFDSPTVCHRWLHLNRWGSDGWIVAGLPGSMVTIPLGAICAYLGSILAWLSVVKGMHGALIADFEAASENDI